MKLQNVHLRLFKRDDARLISKWIVEEEYKSFYRYLQSIPTEDECADFPRWSGNLVMMVDADVVDEKNNVLNTITIGKVIAYQCNLKMGICYAGILIEKKIHKLGFGKIASLLWMDYLFKVLEFRKVLVQYLKKDEFFIKACAHGFSKPILLEEQCKFNGEICDEYLMSCLSRNWKGMEGLCL